MSAQPTKEGEMKLFSDAVFTEDDFYSEDSASEHEKEELDASSESPSGGEKKSKEEKSEESSDEEGEDIQTLRDTIRSLKKALKEAHKTIAILERRESKREDRADDREEEGAGISEGKYPRNQNEKDDVVIELSHLHPRALYDEDPAQTSVAKALSDYIEELKSGSSTESLGWKIFRPISVVLSFLSAKAYVTGCQEAFPDNPGMAYSSAFSSAMLSALPALWAIFALIDKLKKNSPKKEEFVKLEKDLKYIAGLFGPVVIGMLAAVPFAGLTWMSSDAILLGMLLSLNAWLLDGALTVYAVFDMLDALYSRLKFSPKAEDLLSKVRSEFLAELSTQRPYFKDWGRGEFTLSSLLETARVKNYKQGPQATALVWLGLSLATFGLIGYTSVTWSFMEYLFGLFLDNPDTPSVIIAKVVLTGASMFPFGYLMLTQAKDLFETVCEMVSSLWNREFSQFLSRIPAFQIAPKTAISATLAIVAMGSLSGVTNGDMTLNLFSAFIEKITFGNFVFDVDSDGSGYSPEAWFAAACAYFISASFNGTSSLKFFYSVLEWFNGSFRDWLKSSLPDSLSSYISVDLTRSHLLKMLHIYDEVCTAIRELPVDRCALLFNSLPPDIQERITVRIEDFNKVEWIRCIEKIKAQSEALQYADKAIQTIELSQTVVINDHGSGGGVALRGEGEEGSLLQRDSTSKESKCSALLSWCGSFSIRSSAQPAATNSRGGEYVSVDSADQIEAQADTWRCGPKSCTIL